MKQAGETTSTVERIRALQTEIQEMRYELFNKISLHHHQSLN